MTITRDQFLEIKKNYDRLLEQDLNFQGDDDSWKEHGNRTDDAREAVMLAPAADLSCIHDKLSILWNDMKQMEPLVTQEAARELRYIAAIKADVTALGATPGNTLVGPDPMTTTPATLVCTLAAEAGQLHADLLAAEREANTLRKGPLTAVTHKQMEALDEFYGEAADRSDAIESYIPTLRPESLQDALILTALAAQFAHRISEGESFQTTRRAILRITTNVAAFLEAETGASAAALGMTSFGDIQRPFSETAPEARAILAELRQAKAA